MQRTTAKSPAVELAVAEWVLRAAAVVVAVAGLWLLVGAQGAHVTERTALSSAAGNATVRAANDQLGPLAGRADQANRAEVKGPAEVEVRFWRPSGAQRSAWVLVRALPAAAASAGLWLLAGLTRSARRGDPFTRANVRRLTAITGLVAVGGLVGDWGSQAVRRWLLDSSDLANQVGIEVSLSFGFVGVVLLLGVLTEVWRRGVAMRTDLEGLV